MKKVLTIVLASLMMLFAVDMCAAKKTNTNRGGTNNGGVMKEITQAQYKTLVADYTAKTWQFKGKRPAIVDFSATWCGPCKRLSPILEGLAKEYKGKIDFYKVDVDKSAALSQAYGISSVPSVLFCPVNGKPTMIQGLYPKEEIVKVIEHVFNIK